MEQVREKIGRREEIHRNSLLQEEEEIKCNGLFHYLIVHPYG